MLFLQEEMSRFFQLCLPVLVTSLIGSAEIGKHNIFHIMYIIDIHFCLLKNKIWFPGILRSNSSTILKKSFGHHTLSCTSFHRITIIIYMYAVDLLSNFGILNLVKCNLGSGELLFFRFRWSSKSCLYEKSLHILPLITKSRICGRWKNIWPKSVFRQHRYQLLLFVWYILRHWSGRLILPERVSTLHETLR